VIASYNVFVTKSVAASTALPTASENATKSSRIVLLQYPAHRPRSKPYNSARSQKPTSLRLKPKTGFIEVDIPVLTEEHYNADTGAKYGNAMSESRTIQAGGTHGLAGGFSAGPATVSTLRDVPGHEENDGAQKMLQTQVLGGKMVTPSARDPIYLLGAFRNNELHLSHLDAVVQMRPQLHHIDAEEEVGRKSFQAPATSQGARVKPGLESGPVKAESKAIEVKIRDNKDDGKDRNLNENAKLLRDIQVDEWHEHVWIDQADSASREMSLKHLHLESNKGDADQLRACIGNGDWLDRMSAPREDGKKGLLAKLRGRERERARRKKAEEEKRQRLKETASASANPAGPLMDMSSDSESSSGEGSESDPGEGHDDGHKPSDTDAIMTGTTEHDAVEIKDEQPTANTTSDISAAGPVLRGGPVQPPRKSGRAKKGQTEDAIAADD